MEQQKRAARAPQSPLQVNCRLQGRLLFELNGLIHRLRQVPYDVDKLLTAEEKDSMKLSAGVLIGIRNDALRRLKGNYFQIINNEVASGTRCPRCSAVGSKIKHVDQGAGLYALCKKCGNSWQVLDK